jgi:hypothetical protein
MGLDDLRRLAKFVEDGHFVGIVADVAPSVILDATVNLEEKWNSFRESCRMMERLAHKQLRRVPFNNNENGFILEYGKRLGSVMFYEADASDRPRDDAMRIVDVFSNPQQRKYLEVGVGRPRALYVLYPVKGCEILCRGAVMPYYEFSHSERLTDDGWKQLLDSPRRPTAPDWLAPLTAPAKAK